MLKYKQIVNFGFVSFLNKFFIYNNTYKQC